MIRGRSGARVTLRAGGAMPRVRPADVNAVRAWVTWALRAVALTLGACGAYLALKRLIFGLGQGDPLIAWKGYMEVGESDSLSRGIALIALAGALAWGSRRIAHWVVTVAPDGCPACGYTGPGRDGLCPECGLRLDEPRAAQERQG
jgi:hypothetical protein